MEKNRMQWMGAIWPSWMVVANFEIANYSNHLLRTTDIENSSNIWVHGERHKESPKEACSFLLYYFYYELTNFWVVEDRSENRIGRNRQFLTAHKELCRCTLSIWIWTIWFHPWNLYLQNDVESRIYVIDRIVCSLDATDEIVLCWFCSKNDNWKEIN